MKGRDRRSFLSLLARSGLALLAAPGVSSLARSGLATLFPAASLLAGGAADAATGSVQAQEAASRAHGLMLSGNPAEAVTILREAARLDPANPWIFNLMGRAAFMAGQSALSAESFRTALRLDPSDGYARLMLDVLSQKPLPPAPAAEEARQVKPRKPSHLEEQARAELEAFAAKGRASGTRLVMLDPGHGGADKGVTGASGLAEKDLTLSLARRTAAHLADTGAVRVMLTREGDQSVPLWARAALAGLYGADFLLSLHCSAALPGRGAVEVYTFARRETDAQARAVADLENGVARFERPAPPAPALELERRVLTGWAPDRLATASEAAAARFREALAAPKPLDRVALQAAPLKLLETAPCPAMLVQAGFLSNPSEEAVLKDQAFQDTLAAALARALTAALG